MGNPQIIILGIAGAVAILIVIVGVFLTRSEENLVEQRLGRFDQQEAQSFFAGDNDDGEKEEHGIDLADGRKLLDPLNNVLQERNFGKT